MRPLRLSIPAVHIPLRLRGNSGTRLPFRPFQSVWSAQRIPSTQFPIATYGVRLFSLTRPRAADDTLERLEIREGKDLENDKVTNKRRLEEMNKGVLYLILDRDVVNKCRKIIDNTVEIVQALDAINDN